MAGVFEPQPELAEVRLVLVVAPHGFLLGREVEAAEAVAVLHASIHTGEPTASASASAVTSAAAMSAVIRRWGTRPFSFSAALDPLVAQAAVNLTLRFVRVCLAPTTSHSTLRVSELSAGWGVV